MISPQLEMQLAELEQQLNEALPSYRTKIQEIHSALLADPECVTLMTEEQIGLVVRGLIQFSGEELIVAATKTKKAKPSVTDLGLF